MAGFVSGDELYATDRVVRRLLRRIETLEHRRKAPVKLGMAGRFESSVTDGSRAKCLAITGFHAPPSRDRQGIGTSFQPQSIGTNTGNFLMRRHRTLHVTHKDDRVIHSIGRSSLYPIRPGERRHCPQLGRRVQLQSYRLVQRRCKPSLCFRRLSQQRQQIAIHFLIRPRIAAKDTQRIGRRFPCVGEAVTGLCSCHTLQTVAPHAASPRSPRAQSGDSPRTSSDTAKACR